LPSTTTASWSEHFNGQNLDLASVTLSHFNGTNYLKEPRRWRLRRHRAVGTGHYRCLGQYQRLVAGRFEHRRVEFTKLIDPAGLFREYQGDHHGNSMVQISSTCCVERRRRDVTKGGPR
jgi:hypothetical protein